MRIFLFMKRRTNVVDQNRHDIVKGLKTDSRGRRKQIKKVIKSGVGEVKCIKEIKTLEFRGYVCQVDYGCPLMP